MAQLQHDITLNGRKISAELEGSIIEASTMRSLDGDFYLRMTLADPHRELIRSPLLTESSKVTVLGENFRLQQIQKDGDFVVVAFDHEPQWKLRQDKKPLHVARRKMNRVQFAELIVKNTRGIDVFAPRKSDTAPRPRGTSGLPGDSAFGANANITVKGKQATKEQVRNIEAVLRVGIQMKATEAVLISSIMTIIQESSAINLTGGDADSVGLFQQRPSQGWKGLRNIQLAAREYFERAIAFTSKYFATDDAKHPTTNVPLWKICAAVQRPREDLRTRYKQWQEEATNAVRQFNRPGWEVDLSGGPDTFTFVKYNGESAWAALGRLADEVQWRRFMVGNSVWFVPDEWLYAGPPVLKIKEHEKGIQDINFDYDVGKPVGNCEFEVRTVPWATQPGACIWIDDMGAASGKWLVKSLEFDLYTSYTTVSLIKPQPKLAEPTQTPRDTTQPISGNIGVSLIRPIPLNWQTGPDGVVQGKHATGGMPDNEKSQWWAIDWGARPGAPVLAMESGTIDRFSGHEVSEGVFGQQKAFGLTIYLLGDSGAMYFITHLATRTVIPKQKVEIGQQIATVANFEAVTNGKTPSHAHVGVFPKGGDTGHPNVEDMLAAPSVNANGIVPGHTGTTATATTASLRDKIVKWAQYGIDHASSITYTDFINLSPTLTLQTVVNDGSPGLDCVTFIEMVYKAAGAPDPCGAGYGGRDNVEHTQTLLDHCTHISQAQAVAGDIVVFGTDQIGTVGTGVTGHGHHAAILMEDGPTNGNNPWLASHGSDPDPRKVRYLTEKAGQENDTPPHTGIQFLRVPGV